MLVGVGQKALAGETVIADLTDGERAVLELITTGVPNKTVAKRLGISVRAVEDRRRDEHDRIDGHEIEREMYQDAKKPAKQPAGA